MHALTRLAAACWREGKHFGYQLNDAISRCAPDLRSSADRALQWLYANEAPAGGIKVHSKHNIGYPEVTGYLIPTLLKFNQYDYAIHLTKWLLGVQRPEGSYAGP